MRKKIEVKCLEEVFFGVRWGELFYLPLASLSFFFLLILFFSLTSFFSSLTSLFILNLNYSIGGFGCDLRVWGTDPSSTGWGRR